MPMIQLTEPLPLMTPLGEAWAHFIWERGQESLVHFGCFQVATGENWWWPNHQVRLCKNISMEHTTLSPIAPVLGLEEHRNRHRMSTPTQPERKT